ncbi:MULTISPECIES: FtsX-like permease family protein [Streptomyces]|uniref:FtsX-like permease family protein n=1 Tax=Streptomyces TaxID=1883 RepID=UPI00211D5C97|nr:FtsX-like permease family protein [Streptomyces sp. st170]WSV90526.1 hypothetical protein OG449_14805 [Streptomyces globisporus]
MTVKPEARGRGRVAAALDTAAADTGTRVATRAAWLAPADTGPDDHTRTGLRMILGIALLSTATALANTLGRAASGRRRDLAVLRLAGAGVPQVLRLVVAEAVGVGAVLGGVVAAVNLLVVWGALALLGVTSAVVVPWAVPGPVVGAAALLAAGSAVLRPCPPCGPGRSNSPAPVISRPGVPSGVGGSTLVLPPPRA